MKRIAQDVASDKSRDYLDEKYMEFGIKTDNGMNYTITEKNGKAVTV